MARCQVFEITWKNNQTVVNNPLEVGDELKKVCVAGNIVFDLLQVDQIHHGFQL